MPRHALAVSSIIAICVITYLPAVDNSFISDDFGLFPMLEALEQNPAYIFEAPSELFRVMSYVYFWLCFKAFGMTPEPFYWAGIALHIVVSSLVYALVLKTTSRWLAAFAAATFFAAYERHQEAVMWISAANETVLTLNCLLFLILWDRAIWADKESRAMTFVAFSVFVLALFSKEAAVVLLPLAILMLVMKGATAVDIARKSLPLVIIVLAFAAFWLSQSNRNFFITDGHYAPGLHFFPVYFRSLLRLVTPLLPLTLVFVFFKWRAPNSLLFWATLLVLSIAPYSFLTYLDHIPSRNTYWPSVGLAGMIGVLVSSLYSSLKTEHAKRAVILSFCIVVAANVSYIWIKKEPQYRERAAPTRELIATLNSRNWRKTTTLPLVVCGFPLHPWVFSEAVARFTDFDQTEVVLGNACETTGEVTVLRWDQATMRYVAGIEPATASSR